MRITEQTSDTLKLQIKNWFQRWWDIGQVLVPIIVAGTLALYVTITMPQTTLRCHHPHSIGTPPEIVCNLTESSLLTSHTTTLEHIQGAKVDSDYDTGHRIILLSDREEIPMTEEYNDRTLEAYKNVAKIRTFITDSHQSRLRIHEDHRWIFCLASIMIICVGIIILFSKSLTSCLFDKQSGQLTLEYQNLLFRSTVEEKILDEIKVITAKEHTNEKGKTSYGLELVFKSGTSIDLGSTRKNKNLATAINQFLGIDE